LRKIAIVIAVAMVVGGCSSTIPPPRETSRRISVEQAQADLGALAIATTGHNAMVSLGRPLTRREGAGMGALIGASAPVILGGQIPPYGVLAGIMIAPLTSIVGTVYGVLAGKSAKEIEQAAQMIEAAGKAPEIQYQLRDLVLGQLGRAGFSGVIALEETASTAPLVDTIAEVWITGITLVGEGINPGLTLELSGGMRLVRGGVEVGYRTLSSTGQRHTLLKWAADDGELFKAQIAHDSEKLAHEIVNTFLSRPMPTYLSTVKYGTIQSAVPGGVVVTAKETRRASWTFAVDSKTLILKPGTEDATVADLQPGDEVVVYTAPDSTVAQVIFVVR
jgi:hypothetical protein